jgi:1-deoxy-D-xylulose-5-phosphate synthase
MMRTIPNFVVAAPKDGVELKEMLKIALHSGKPFVIRFPKGYANQTYKSVPVKLGKAEKIFDGDDLLIVSIGAVFERAYNARILLQKRNISTGLVNERFVKPLDGDILIDLALKTRRVLTIEDNVVAGGFGSAINELLSDKSVAVKNIGINDFFPEQGKRDFLLDKYGMNANIIADIGEKFAKEKNR